MRHFASAALLVLASISASALACERTATIDSSPATVEPTAALPPAAAEPSAATTEVIELRPIALRDGPLALFATGEHAYLSMDGEAIALRPGIGLDRLPAHGRGLPPRESYWGFPTFEILAFAGDPGVPDSAWVVIAEHFDRAGSSFSTFRLGAEGWGVVRRKHEMLTEYYPALVGLPGGVTLGVRSYNFDSADIQAGQFHADDEGRKAEAYWQSVEAALSSAPKGLVVLSGDPKAAPEVPVGWLPTSLARDRGGRLYAIAERDGEGDEPPQLLIWEPGAREATTLALPGRASASSKLYELKLMSSGDDVLVAGFESAEGDDRQRLYLAAGAGSSWTRVPVELPRLESEWDMQVTSAARTDTGELWLTTGNPMFVFDADDVPHLWRQRGGSWEPVALAPVTSASDGASRWIRSPLEDAWVEIQAAEAKAQDPRAMAVAWSEGTLWVLADVGPAFLDRSESTGLAERRVAVYASQAAPPVELPSFARVHRERVNWRARERGLKPGESGCEHVSVVLLDDPDGENTRERDAIVDRYEDLRETIDVDGAWITSLYVGRGDTGPDQLILEVNARNPKAADKLRAALDRELGLRSRADCQLREFTRTVSEW